MSNGWKTTTLTSESHVMEVLVDLRGRRWLSRGQAQSYGELIPSIDRGHLLKLPRSDKLALERQSINIFRSTARFFADQGESGAMADDIVALMVLRHYGVPTRLLDWSMSPFVAAYFSAAGSDKEDGEIWTLDEPFYESVGAKQWARWKQTTTDGSGDPAKFDAKLTAFTTDEPPDWFICGFYTGFPRQDAQSGAYTMSARFGRDHAEAITNLMADVTRHHLYVVPAQLKPALRRVLREQHGIWRGALFPDSAGAADTARTVFSPDP
ncbi:MAG TPA: FRG domain-containing protein [Candidatus Saccharimonadaceae bacterium]|jgi:hypothetical protein|nr:FRG domain-containing protein [Candidatus Saccharimonadaceae bacterium]